MLIRCAAIVYTPAAITVLATEKKSAQICSSSLVVVVSTCSLISFSVCSFLLLLSVGPILPSVFSFEFCSVFNRAVHNSYVL